MKKALALVLALSLGVSAFATEFVELTPAPAGGSGVQTVKLVDVSAENVLRVYEGNTYYVAVKAPDGKEYKDLTVSANGNVSVKVLDFLIYICYNLNTKK